jgi:hypothetical protein
MQALGQAMVCCEAALLHAIAMQGRGWVMPPQLSVTWCVLSAQGGQAVLRAKTALQGCPIADLDLRWPLAQGKQAVALTGLITRPYLKPTASVLFVRREDCRVLWCMLSS